MVNVRFRQLTNHDFSNYFRGENNYKGFVSLHDDLEQWPELEVDDFLIVNLDKPAGGGTHWVMVYLVNKDTLIYFDSFGVSYSSKIVDYMKRLGIHTITYSNIKIQDLNGITCGYYVLYVIDKLQDGVSFEAIVKSLQNETKVNRKILAKHFGL